MSALALETVVEVQAEIGLARCACGGHPKRYSAEIGQYVICARPGCVKRGSGVFRSRDDAARAWNDLQAEAAEGAR